MTRDRYIQFVLFSLHSFQDIPKGLSDEDWIWIYNESVRQSIVGITYQGVRLKLCSTNPPKELEAKWKEQYDKIEAANKVITKACCELSYYFKMYGFDNAILKGLSKAILYPNPMARTPGDIDIWLDGGKKKVLGFIEKNGIIGQEGYHHFHTTAEIVGYPEIPLEIHFRPSSGSFSPFKNRIIQKVLEEELHEIEYYKIKDGNIYTPSKLFAVVSELIHIRRHFVGGGIGLRHMLDLYMLLKQCPLAHRKYLVKRLGLLSFTGAVSYVMCECMGMDNAKYFPIPSNEKSGKKLWNEIFLGGNFGRYAPRQEHGFFVRGMLREYRTLRLFSLCPSEFIWWEIQLWSLFVRTIPKRIMKRSWSLR